VEHLLLDLWVEELKRHFEGQFLTGLECLGEGYVQLLFGRKQPRMLLHLKPQRVWHCFSNQLSLHRSPRPTDIPQKVFQAARLQSITRVPADRILWISIAAKESDFALVLELIPSSPNILILNPVGEIIWQLNEDRLSCRRLSVGAAYQVPDRPKRFSLEEAVKEPPMSGITFERWLQRNVEGVSPLVALELVQRAAGDIARLPEAWDQLRQEPIAPHLYAPIDLQHPDMNLLDPWRNMRLSPWRLSSQQSHIANVFPTINGALECFAQIAVEWEEFQELRKKLLGPAKTRLNRLQHAIAAANDDYRRMEDPARFRTFGELLLCHLGQLQHGGLGSQSPLRKSEICIADHYASPGSLITIPVDADKSLQANAETYFKLARKAQRGMKMLLAHLKELERQVAQTQALYLSILSAGDLLGLKKFDHAPAEPSSSRKVARPSQGAGNRRPRSYSSYDGYEILVGQSAANNEALTFRLAAASDIWLHVADYSGSHVVIRNPSRQPVPHNTLIQAAALAAFYSGARRQPKVEVRYTERKFVHKVKGAAAGLVRLQQFKSIYVEPSRHIIRQQS
jgi:predicted ribosome quality control (RQC) complex YloA/Tae2 family protein